MCVSVRLQGTGKFLSVCVCLCAYARRARTKRLCVRLSKKEGCHFKSAPGQGNIEHNTMNNRNTRTNKIKKHVNALVTWRGAGPQ